MKEMLHFYTMLNNVNTSSSNMEMLVLLAIDQQIQVQSFVAFKGFIFR